MGRFLLWLRRLFFFQVQSNFKVGDKVVWDVSSEDGLSLFKEFGKGPFHVAGFKDIPDNLFLSDFSGIILVGKHYHPKVINATLLKLK